MRVETLQQGQELLSELKEVQRILAIQKGIEERYPIGLTLEVKVVYKEPLESGKTVQSSCHYQSKVAIEWLKVREKELINLIEKL